MIDKLVVMSEDGICIGYWLDGNDKKTYAVAHVRSIKNIPVFQGYSMNDWGPDFMDLYKDYVYLFWIEDPQSRRFDDLNESREYAITLNKDLKTAHGVIEIGNFGFSLPKELKLRAFT